MAPPIVPKVAGLTLDAARELLTKTRLHPGAVTEVTSDTIPKGQVISSAPVVGVEVKAETLIDLVVSSGPDASAIPSVIGKRQSKAKELLEKAGFVVGNTTMGSNDDYDQGVVIKQNPAANAQAARGAKVDLVIND